MGGGGRGAGEGVRAMVSRPSTSYYMMDNCHQGELVVISRQQRPSNQRLVAGCLSFCDHFSGCC